MASTHSITEVNVLGISFREVQCQEGQKFFAPTRPVVFTLGSGTPGVVPWGASAYEDDGTAKRVNLCIRVSEDVVAAVRNLEARAESALGVKLNSCVKNDILRVKVWIDDDHIVNVWNLDKERLETSVLRMLKNEPINAMIEFRGVYTTEHGSGLVLDAYDVLVGRAERPACPW
jgi:hypothetical protein